MIDPELLAALAPIAERFEEMGISYQIGGSVASSAVGLPRSTLDIDLVAAIRVDQAQAFTEGLERTYYVDAEMIRDAVRRRSSFNLVHLSSMLKLDVFVPKAEPFAVEAFRRRLEIRLGGGPDSRTYPISTAEDVVLHKLDWYRLGGHVSERQWGDVLGVLRVQHGSIDLAYLRRWASELDLLDLLEQALRESSAAG